MSGIINKVKAAVSGDHSTSTTHTTGTGVGHTTGTAEGVHGPHSSRAANAADPRVDSDRDGSHHVGGTTHSGVGHTTGTHTTGTHTTGTGIGGTHTGTHTGTGVGHSTGTAEGVHGPHSSRAANAADPRVDSDRDGSRHVGNTGVGHNTHATTGTHTGTHTTSGPHTTAGPHSSDLLNKADPRVDSDNSKLHNTHAGVGPNTHGSGLTGTGIGNNTHNTHGTHTTGSGLTGNTHNTHGTHTTGSGLTGGTHNTGSAVTGSTGTHGGISHSTNAGPHNSNLANKADPRVDSDLDSTGNRHTHGSGGITGHSGSHATPGSGTAQNTAGPHNSDLLNKIDPRVDSDLSGGKTFGGNKTNA